MKTIRENVFETNSSSTHSISFSKNKTMNHPTRSKLKTAFTILYVTGCRISEIVNFTKEDIESMIKNKEFSLNNSNKTKIPRLIEFSDSQISLLEKKFCMTFVSSLLSFLCLTPALIALVGCQLSRLRTRQVATEIETTTHKPAS